MLALVSAALAHDEVGELAKRPFVRDGELVGAWTTSGVTVRDEDGAFRRVCAEAFPTLNDAWLREDGAVLLASVDGLLLAPELGCATPSAPLWPGMIAAVLPAGDAVYAVALEDEGPRLLRSTDRGDGWEALPALPGGPWLYGNLAVDGRGRPVLAGVDALGPAVAAWDGATFVVDRAPEDPAGFFVTALGAAPDGVGITVATFGFAGTSRLWASSDAGWVPLVDLPEGPTGYGCVAGLCVAATTSALHRWDPAIGEASLVVVDGPSQCLVAADGALWACRERLAEALVETSRDGRAFAPALLTAETTDRGCAAVCVPPADTGTPPTTEPPPPPPPEDERRGCATAPGSGLALLLALSAARRAGPRSAPATGPTPGRPPAPRTARPPPRRRHRPRAPGPTPR